MKLNLTHPHDRPYGYRRGDLKGDVLGAAYAWEDIEGLVTPQFAMARDFWAERAVEAGAVDREQAAAYIPRLNELLKGFAPNDDASFEEIYVAARRLRRQVFGDGVVDRAELLAAQSPLPAFGAIHQAARKKALLEKCSRVLMVLSDTRLATLARKDLQTILAAGGRVWAARAGEEGDALPRDSVMETLLPGAAPVVFADGGLEGDMEEELAAAIGAGDVCLLHYGERGLGLCRGMRIPAFVQCVPRSLPARALAGQFTRNDLCGIYVPQGLDILPWVPLVGRTLISYRHLARLADAHGDGVYHMDAETLYRRWPEEFFSVYDETDSGLPSGLVWPDKGESREGWYADFCRRRDQAIGEYLTQAGVQSLNGWFSLEGLESAPVPWEAEGEARGMLVHGARIEKPAGARVVLSEGEAISPRILMADAPDNPPALQIISNYLFFLTPRLAELYNRLRSDRPLERTAMRGGHLDYMLYEQDGERVETFPLYKKACMGMTEEGRFVFFHFRLRGGECEIGGQKIAWSEADVDNETPGCVAVYTPYLSRADAGAPRFEYVRPVGAGRVNFVINQTELTCVRDGDVLLPGTGVVLSLEREYGLFLVRSMGLEAAENGYYVWTAPPLVRARLQSPEEIEPEAWAKMKWAYGGGLTLVSGGRALFGEGEDSDAHLDAEGWASPLSGQTQESDIAAPARHPRTGVGLTRSGALVILVFSGRSSVSAGADYTEMCRIARRLVPDLTDMINVDGGGSAVLGFAAGRQFVEYSWPSTSFGSVSGMVRPVNSLLCVTVRP